MPNQRGMTPLFWACFKGLPTVVDALLENGAKFTQDKEGDTPLNVAIREGHPEIAVKLIQYDKSSINTPNQDGDTPLSWACHNNLPTVVEALLKNGANVDVKDKAGETPLSLAIRQEHLEIALKLIPYLPKSSVDSKNKHG